jgi:hypothetical protein
MGKNHGAT